ncbi:MAG TPA: hypothetical protein DCL01_06095 [Thauera sp.]|nr:hypothetical protein [Thauera sp.]HHW66006.1 hypothetical protein [Rhodocyclaceae bacterium]
MELKPIRTDAEHADALAEVERLWDAPEGSAEADRLEVLVMLVEARLDGPSAESWLKGQLAFDLWHAEQQGKTKVAVRHVAPA